jgi:hypothetical protein
MTATIIPADRLEALRKQRVERRRQREALEGSILAPLDDEPEQPVCGVASSEPIGDTAKWLKRILTP